MTVLWALKCWGRGSICDFVLRHKIIFQQIRSRIWLCFVIWDENFFFNLIVGNLRYQTLDIIYLNHQVEWQKPSIASSSTSRCHWHRKIRINKCERFSRLESRKFARRLNNYGPRENFVGREKRNCRKNHIPWGRKEESLESFSVDSTTRILPFTEKKTSPASAKKLELLMVIDI